MAQRTQLLQHSVIQQGASDWCNAEFETGLYVGPVTGRTGNYTVVGADIFTPVQKGKVQKP